MNPKIKVFHNNPDIFHRTSLNLSQSQTKRKTNMSDNIETINLDEQQDCAEDKESGPKKNSQTIINIQDYNKIVQSLRESQNNKSNILDTNEHLQANHQKLVNIMAKRNIQKDSQSKDSENLADNMDAISQKSVKSILSGNNKN